MGKAKKTRKFAAVKRMLNPKDLKCGAPSPHPIAARLACARLASLPADRRPPPLSRRPPTPRRRRAAAARQPPHLLPRRPAPRRRPPAEKQPKKEEVRHVEKQSAALFFKYNTQLGPPYQVLVDTNFINFSIKNKVSGTCALRARCCWRALPLPARSGG
jgi:hypothetical protein